MADDDTQTSPKEREAQLKRQQSAARNSGGQNTNQGNTTPGTPTRGSFPGASPKTNTRGGSTSRPSPGSGGQMGGFVSKQAGQQGGSLIRGAASKAASLSSDKAKAQNARQGSTVGNIEERLRREAGKRTAQALATYSGIGAAGAGVAGKVGEKVAGSKVAKYVIWGGCAVYGLFWFFIIILIIFIPILYVKSQCDIKNNTAIVRFARAFFNTGTFGLTEVGLKALCDQIK